MPVTHPMKISICEVFIFILFDRVTLAFILITWGLCGRIFENSSDLSFIFFFKPITSKIQLAFKTSL